MRTPVSWPEFAGALWPHPRTFSSPPHSQMAAVLAHKWGFQWFLFPFVVNLGYMGKLREDHSNWAGAVGQRSLGRQLGDPARQPAVNNDCVACEVVIRGQEHDDVGNLLGRSFAMERNVVLEVELFALWGHIGVKAAAYHAGSDSVYADVLVRRIAGKR